jgi:RNA polymerase sigma factor (sigma-70 family)
MPTDAELLRLYADSDSQEAFTSLVQRHLPFTYSAALRQVGGNAHQAQEVVQRVFTLLARKARGLSKHPALIGWLCTTTYYAAAKLRRAEQRRAQAEAAAVNEDGSSDLRWDHLRPVIDDLLLELKERDRTAVLLRFFSNQSYGEIGEKLGLTENAARMRVERALESLRTVLSKRGIVSTSTALGSMLSTQAIGAVPEGLVAIISKSAMSAVATGAGVFIFMGSTFVKVGVAVGVLVASSAGFILHQQSAAENARLHEQLAATQRQLAAASLAERRHQGVSTGGVRAELPESSSVSDVSVVNGGSQSPSDLQKSLVRLKDLRNVGLATPVDALQTILWAIENGHESLPDMLMLNKPARDVAPQMMAELSASEREVYDTPEKVAALYLSKFLLEQIDAVRVEAIIQTSYDTVNVKIITQGKGASGAGELSMQWTPGGWLWKMKPSLIESARKDLKVRRSASPVGDGK